MNETVDRDAIRARADAATPGPWSCYATVPYEVFVEPVGDDHDSPAIAHQMVWQCDAEFIAHARTDVPALLDALAAAEAERDEARRLSVEWRADMEQYAKVKAERDAARAEVEAMRPVVEAASEWRAARKAHERQSNFPRQLAAESALERVVDTFTEATDG